MKRKEIREKKTMKAIEKRERKKKTLMVWFVGFYGISTFVGYLTPNPFLCK